MSRQAGGKPRAKPPPQPYSGYEPELYEEVDMQEIEKPSVDTKKRYTAAPERSQSQKQPRQQPHQQPYQHPAPSVAKYPVEAKESRKPMNKAHLMLIGMISVFLLCTVVLCLLAVILYRPQNDNSEALMSKLKQLEEDVKRFKGNSSAQTMEALLYRIEQLESRVEQLQTVQGTNYTLDTLTSLQETQESVEASISRLSAFERSASSQLISVQNLILGQSSIQNNIRQDLDRLRSVNLTQGCTKMTESCTMSSSGSYYYWRSCSAGNIYINQADTQYYYEGMRCEYQSNYDYIESATLRKSGNNYYCWCDVTRLSSSSHSYLSTSLSATCTLSVTRCPRSVNLLS